ncbi:group 1 glycosyl transferase [Niastella koreensis]|uniref:Glycosyl transferase group 1 n=3 Tax=Niastella koreensis TaxID=354356 RepID=G8TR63_NIAKG|nr:glycosyl transferase group 1 [Niastella koreensis GR20-10]OQP43898.1 group 1 glycosyl transferase [Niastella koreensis]
MIRICTSLAEAGYAVTLIGRRFTGSPALVTRPFKQKRLFCFFRTGKLSYLEYNLRLFLCLLFIKADGVCAIDLDTILPFYFISKLKGIPRVYDAHELFCEMKEVVTRPRIYKVWKWVERYAVPKFKHGYTVNKPIADEFKMMYRTEYEVIRNVPVWEPLEIPDKPEKFILFQGAVNEGRSFETLIPAMQYVNAPFVICGNGNFMIQAEFLASEYDTNHRIEFKGRILPAELKELTKKAWIGVTLFENNGLSNYYSLANRFFDYIHAGIPQLCVDYPAYREINNKYNIAVLTSDLRSEALAERLNELLNNKNLYYQLQQNCLQAREAINWQQEEKKLLAFYKNIL